MLKLLMSLIMFLTVSCAVQESQEGILYTLSEQGLDQAVGKIVVKAIEGGIAITVHGTNLIPGDHGFHIHETNTLTPSTNAEGNLVIGGMAGGHWDPDNTGLHLGPDGDGHRGDLPQLNIPQQEIFEQTIVSKKVQFSDIKGKSFMVHVNPDNYSDTPSPLGGSGPRLYASPF